MQSISYHSLHEGFNRKELGFDRILDMISWIWLQFYRFKTQHCVKMLRNVIYVTVYEIGSFGNDKKDNG